MHAFFFVTISALIAQAQPGSVVEIPGGTYQDKVIIAGAHGLTVRPRAGEHVTLEGSIEIRDSASIVVRGLEVRGASQNCITSWGSVDVTIAGNDVHDCGRAGIWAGYDRPGISRRIVISDNKVTNCVLENRARTAVHGWSQGIGVQYSDDVTISGNRVLENYGEGINVCVTDHSKVTGNQLSDDYSFDIYLDNARWALVDGNTITTTNDRRFFRYGEPASGIGAANEQYPFTTSLSHITVTNNVIRGARYGFYYGNYGRGGGLHDFHITGNTFAVRRRPVYIEK
ncbi:MAG TPA: right-handed parallel beta-helix repeat-containing protein [Thermoanaerobaculia bacterium]